MNCITINTIHNPTLCNFNAAINVKIIAKIYMIMTIALCNDLNILFICDIGPNKNKVDMSVHIFPNEYIIPKSIKFIENNIRDPTNDNMKPVIANIIKPYILVLYDSFK
jgi:hypothetical protein